MILEPSHGGFDLTTGELSQTFVGHPEVLLLWSVHARMSFAFLPASSMGAKLTNH